MECPKCGGIMIYNKRTDKLECLSCFYKRSPNDRIKRFRFNDEWLDEDHRIIHMLK